VTTLTPNSLPKVAIVEDELLLLGLLTEFFTKSGRFQIVGAYASGVEAVEKVCAMPPDLVVMDLQMPDMNGLTLIQTIRARLTVAPKFFVLSNNTNPLLIKQLMRSGVRGILQKGVAATEVLAACERVLRGAVCLNLPEGDMIELAGASFSESDPSLTTREIEILDLVVRGRRSKAIADTLGLSVRTIEKHRENLMKKLGVHDVGGLVRYAAKTGMLINGGGLSGGQRDDSAHKVFLS
jgi:DNA-binding NarL/FixJ family response regulator